MSGAIWSDLGGSATKDLPLGNTPNLSSLASQSFSAVTGGGQNFITIFNPGSYCFQFTNATLSYILTAVSGSPTITSLNEVVGSSSGLVYFSILTTVANSSFTISTSGSGFVSPLVIRIL